MFKTLKEISLHPDNYKICLNCGSVLLEHLEKCFKCGSVEFNEDNDQIIDVVNHEIHYRIYQENFNRKDAEAIIRQVGKEKIKKKKHYDLPEGRYLGKLCHQGHEYKDSKRSLRYVGNRECVECHKRFYDELSD